jgi:(2Fe-2S) ferredoxin
MDHKIHTTRTRCNGRCKDACVVVVYPEGVWYKAACPDLAKKIVQDHLVDGKVVEDSVIYTYNQQHFAAPEHSESIVGIDKQKSKV